MPISNQYRSPATVSKATVILVTLNASVILLSLGFDLLDLNLIHEIERGKQPSDAAIYASDTRQETIGRIAVLVFVFTAICFLRWVYVSAQRASLLQKNSELFSGMGCCVVFHSLSQPRSPLSGDERNLAGLSRSAGRSMAGSQGLIAGQLLVGTLDFWWNRGSNLVAARVGRE